MSCHGLSTRPAAAALVVFGLAIAGCSSDSGTHAKAEQPAKLVDVAGTTLKQVVLTQKASERLGIQLVPIADQGGVQVMPYAALVYDAKGNTWAYTSPTPLTFVRAPVAVADIVGDFAVLSSGPGAGTGVVTVGMSELYGAENKIGQTSGH